MLTERPFSDPASCRWSATATHTGDLFGMPPTRKKVAMIGITFFRVENGQGFVDE